ncbi:MAG: hypothetical protein OXN27_00060 [Candidatus Poribacteria bacterium]|nr:hypothetical protein [Candidatus Poribacteria bacterium]
MRNKRAGRNRNPRSEKIPTSRSIVSTQNKKLVWKVARIDDDSPWGWNQITCPDFLRKIWDKMHNFETMTWGEILGRNHHAIAVNDIIKPAQNRLEQLGHDDQAELVSFRLSNTERIWAIRSGEEAFLLWWDPNHEICPSHLQNM